jgi:hypothetical protein
MAITINPDEEIPEVVRNQSFSASVSASADDTEVIEQVTATLQGTAESGIVITPGETSVTISGRVRRRICGLIHICRAW